MTVFFTVTAVKKQHRNNLELLASCLADACLDLAIHVISKLQKWKSSISAQNIE